MAAVAELFNPGSSVVDVYKYLYRTHFAALENVKKMEIEKNFVIKENTNLLRANQDLVAMVNSLRYKIDNEDRFTSDGGVCPCSGDATKKKQRRKNIGIDNAVSGVKQLSPEYKYHHLGSRAPPSGSDIQGTTLHNTTQTTHDAISADSCSIHQCSPYYFSPPPAALVKIENSEYPSNTSGAKDGVVLMNRADHKPDYEFIGASWGEDSTAYGGKSETMDAHYKHNGLLQSGSSSGSPVKRVFSNGSDSSPLIPVAPSKDLRFPWLNEAVSSHGDDFGNDEQVYYIWIRYILILCFANYSF